MRSSSTKDSTYGNCQPQIIEAIPIKAKVKAKEYKDIGGDMDRDSNFSGEAIVGAPISKFTSDTRGEDAIVAFSGKYSDGQYVTWRQFLDDTAMLRAYLKAKNDIGCYILHAEDRYLFLAAYVALLQCGKEVMLTANMVPGYIGLIRAQRPEEAIGILTDKATTIDGAQDIAGAIKASDTADDKIPIIVAKDTNIVLWTSGSTGEPKAVPQRLVEFEEDNAFILSKWEKEIVKRKMVSVVSHHHIYGLLFSVMLPFTAGIPFKRERIEYPEVFEGLTDTSYMIVAVPAFLKRATKILSPLGLKEPFIWTSGGMLEEDTARATSDIFGFWPIEIYGSTETSGIAYRCSREGKLWQVFDNAKIWAGEDGCLVIKSPYIKDTNGFATRDLVDIKENGKFLLLGRIDRVVKIEEKRVSLAEVEARIEATGLVEDTSVVALESDRRQYLAAVVVLNDKGKKKFMGAAKVTINRYFRDYLQGYFEPVVIPRRWRYMDAIPCDVQGKKLKGEIAALFAHSVVAGLERVPTMGPNDKGR